MLTALFAGSFDPFTVGHADIVTRGLKMFDSIVIAIGVNDQKHPYFSLEQRFRQLSHYYASDDRVTIVSYSGLTTEVARQYGASVLLRGIRSSIDYEYERSLADINYHLSGIETVLMFTAQHLSHVSSGSVRELLNHGCDVSSLLPPGFILS